MKIKLKITSTVMMMAISMAACSSERSSTEPDNGNQSRPMSTSPKDDGYFNGSENSGLSSGAIGRPNKADVDAWSVKADGYSADPVGESESHDKSSLKVKGLYVGMNIRDVPNAFRNSIGDAQVSVHEVAKGDAGKFPNVIARPESYYVAIGGMVPIGFVLSDPDKTVTDIVFTPRLVDIIFKVEGMEASSFAQEFIDAYDVPEMKVADDRKSWFYMSPDGVKLSIVWDKSVILHKVEIPNARKGSFN